MLCRPARVSEHMAACEEIHVTVPLEEPDRSAALAALQQALNSLPSSSLAEVWVDLDPFPALCALSGCRVPSRMGLPDSACVRGARLVCPDYAVS